jgi:SUMO ligase MMS21 Smc5/6 complex component
MQRLKSLVWNELLSEMCILMLEFSSHMTKLYTGHQVFKKYFERVLVPMWEGKEKGNIGSTLNVCSYRIYPYIR